MTTYEVQQLAIECAKWEAIASSEVPINIAMDNALDTVGYLGLGKESPFMYVFGTLIRIQQIYQDLHFPPDKIVHPTLKDLQEVFGALNASGQMSMGPVNLLTFKIYQVRDSLFSLLEGKIAEHNLQAVRNMISNEEFQA